MLAPGSRLSHLRTWTFATHLPAALLFVVVPALAQSPILTVDGPQLQTPAFDPLIAARPKDRITETIDEDRRVRRYGNVYPRVNAAYDVGRLAPGSQLRHIFLLLRSDPEQLAALHVLNSEQQDPHSPLYHHWLTPQVFGLHFGVSEHDLAAVTAWLQSKGLTVDLLSPDRRQLLFSGTVAAVESAFHTEMHRYRIDGVMHRANATDPEIPAALADVVEGPVPLHDFPLRSMSAPPDPYLLGSLMTIGPDDFATIYDLNPLSFANIDGTGETIAIVAASNIQISDLTPFREQGGSLPNLPLNVQVILEGSDPGLVCPDISANQCDWREATLDVERAMTVAPGAQIKLIVGMPLSDQCNPNCFNLSVGGVSLASTPIMDAAFDAVVYNEAPIVSVSFGECESGLGATGTSWWNDLWNLATTNGISVFVASGDTGAASCENQDGTGQPGKAVNGICSPVWVTCVGGTEVSFSGSTYWLQGSALSYIPESVWNQSGGSDVCCASGGGIGMWSKPSYQDALTPAGGYRDVPDVSLIASSYLINFNGALTTAGGTSASTPSFAGIMALFLQNLGGPRWGNAAPYLYAEAQATQGSYSNPFHPTISGNNSVPGTTGFSASGSVYNLATGLGSVDGAILLENTSGTYKPTLTITASSQSIVIGNYPGATGSFTVHVATGGGFFSQVQLTTPGARFCDDSGWPATLSLTSPAAPTLLAPGNGDVTYTFQTSASASGVSSSQFYVEACGQGVSSPLVPITVTFVNPVSVLGFEGGNSGVSFGVYDIYGGSDVGSVYILVNTSQNDANACYLEYNANTKSIQLANDAGTGWLAAVPLGTGSPISTNSQCTLNPAASSVGTSGNYLNVNVGLSFAGTFAGTKNVYVEAYEVGGHGSGWINLGTLNAATGTPSITSVSPSSATGMSQTFTIEVSDVTGGASIGYVYTLVSPSLTDVNSCLIQYNATANTISLANNAGTGLSTPVLLGAGSPISNSQCTLDPSASSGYVVDFCVALHGCFPGNDLILNLALSFAPTYGGPNNVYVQAYSLNNQSSGWQSESAGAISNIATPCAVSGGNILSVFDVQSVINEALGVFPASSDLNSDGVVNIVDVQLVVDVALGGSCR